MKRWLLVLAFSCALDAQIQIFTFDGKTETPAGAITDFGTVAPGDVKEVRFRFRNNTQLTLTFDRFDVQGQGFAKVMPPTLPMQLPPSSFVEIVVRFSASSPASYSATLTANTSQILLRATVTQTAIVSLAGVGALAQGATVDFGLVQRGQSGVREISITNTTDAAVTLRSCAVSGTAFSAAGLACPMTLMAGEAKPMKLTFSPAVSGTQSGSLSIDSRTFALAGTGFEPPLPKAVVDVDAPLKSAAQPRLAIRFDEPSQTTGTGTVAMSFEPTSKEMPDDAAIQFTRTGSRTLSFSIAEGASTPTFPTGIEPVFQTGTTAGTIVFLVTMGGAKQTFTFPVAGTAMVVSRTTAVRRAGAIDVSLTGYDNTGSAGKFAFTFYDAAGAAIQPGSIAANWTNQFTNYFRGSKSGGSFTMMATFPVSGDGSKITAVEVQAVNAAGTAKVDRISF